MRLSSGIALAVVSTGLAGAACAGEVARDWLDRVNVALDELTYIGTFVRLTNGDHETMHVAHRYVDGALNERIVSLDGVGREILRLDDDVLVILPDQKVVMFEKVIASNPMVAALPDYSRKLEANYELQEFGTEKVAGREAQIISIRPRDDYRYGYMIWLDVETYMPLRSKSWNDAEQVVEEIFFTEIDYPEQLPDSAFEQTVDSHGFTALQTSDPQSEQVPGRPWTIEALPDGFELTASMLKSMGDSQQPVVHLVYTDGLATVSVFIDGADAETDIAAGYYPLGSTNAYSLTKDGRVITAIGEVPRRTVEAIATSVRLR